MANPLEVAQAASGRIINCFPHSDPDVVGPKVAGCYTNSIALRGDGSTWVWGGSLYGQLCDDITEGSSMPVQVTGLSGVVALDAGDAHTIAQKCDRSIWTWGDNIDGKLGRGDGGPLYQNTPGEVQF